MSEDSIDSETTSKPAPALAQPKGECKHAKKAMAAKKPTRTKKATAKPKADRTNKKAEVIAMMKRAKGAVGRAHEGHRLAGVGFACARPITPSRVTANSPPNPCLHIGFIWFPPWTLIAAPFWLR